MLAVVFIVHGLRSDGLRGEDIWLHGWKSGEWTCASGNVLVVCSYLCFNVANSSFLFVEGWKMLVVVFVVHGLRSDGLRGEDTWLHGWKSGDIR